MRLADTDPHRDELPCCVISTISIQGGNGESGSIQSLRFTRMKGKGDKRTAKRITREWTMNSELNGQVGAYREASEGWRKPWTS